MRIVINLAFVCTAWLAVGIAVAAPPLNGTVTRHENAPWQAWDGDAAEWTDVETFWLHYTESQGGLTFGPRTDYPEYSNVNEHDTLLIQLEQGACLMEFFHSRWRRANDVRRWDDAFNDYGGCPYVFE